MAKTASDLITATLQELGVINAVENPSAEDSALIYDSSTSPPSGRWASINSYLRKTRVSTWTENSIPEEVFEPLVLYVAIRLSGPFGVQFENKEAVTKLRLSDLKTAAMQRMTGQTLKSDFPANTNGVPGTYSF